MILHFHNARLIDPEAQTDEIGALTVEDGRITARDGDAPQGATVIDCNGRALAPGIVDWGVKIGEPGERHKESFRSAGLAAAAGGVTTIIARPDTMPAIDTPDPGPAGFSGSLVVAEFASLEAAREWIAQDPYTLGGVFERTQVRPFNKVLP